MSDYIDRSGDEIWLASPSPIDSLWTMGILAILIPVSLVVCPLFLLSDTIADNFHAAGLMFFVLSAIIGFVMARLKYKKISDVVIDFIGNVAIFYSYYLITFMYSIPNISIKSEGIFVWIFFVFVITAIIFIRQCIRRVVDNAVLNCAMGIALLLITYIIFCLIIHQSSFDEIYVFRTYGITESDFSYKVIKLLFYIPSIL